MATEQSIGFVVHAYTSRPIWFSFSSKEPQKLSFVG